MWRLRNLKPFIVIGSRGNKTVHDGRCSTRLHLLSASAAPKNAIYDGWQSLAAVNDRWTQFVVKIRSPAATYQRPLRSHKVQRILVQCWNNVLGPDTFHALVAWQFVSRMSIAPSIPAYHPVCRSRSIDQPLNGQAKRSRSHKPERRSASSKIKVFLPDVVRKSTSEVLANKPATLRLAKCRHTLLGPVDDPQTFEAESSLKMKFGTVIRLVSD
jgi:hypothetical protein